MTTEAQLKRYEQLNQLQVSRYQIPQSQKTFGHQKRIVIPFSKQKKNLSKQMLISDQLSNQRNNNYPVIMDVAESSKTAQVYPADTLSVPQNNKIVSTINKQHGLPFDPYMNRSEGLDQLLNQHTEQGMQQKLKKHLNKSSLRSNATSQQQMKQSSTSFFNGMMTGMSFKNESIRQTHDEVSSEASNDLDKKIRIRLKAEKDYREEGNKKDPAALIRKHRDDIPMQDKRKAKSITQHVLKQNKIIAQRRVQPLKSGIGQIRLLEQRTETQQFFGTESNNL